MYIKKVSYIITVILVCLLFTIFGYSVDWGQKHYFKYIEETQQYEPVEILFSKYNNNICYYSIKWEDPPIQQTNTFQFEGNDQVHFEVKRNGEILNWNKSPGYRLIGNEIKLVVLNNCNQSHEKVIFDIFDDNYIHETGKNFYVSRKTEWGAAMQIQGVPSRFNIIFYLGIGLILVASGIVFFLLREWEVMKQGTQIQKVLYVVAILILLAITWFLYF